MPRDFKLYLDDIVGSIDRVFLYVAGMEFEGFSADQRTVDAVVRNLEIIGEAARSLPDEVKEACPEIEWRKIIGLRNILTHEYFGINQTMVWDIVQSKLRPLRMVCNRLLESPEST